MPSVVLSAASPALPALQQLSAQLDDVLRADGDLDVRTFTLATTPLAYCQGEFDCWVKTPGLCRAHDEEHDIMQAIHDAERLVLVDAVTFGGHSFTLKRAQDRLIGLVAPFFEKRAALTHHAARYSRPAAFYALGWQPLAVHFDQAAQLRKVLFQPSARCRFEEVRVTGKPQLQETGNDLKQSIFEPS